MTTFRDVGFPTSGELVSPDRKVSVLWHTIDKLIAVILRQQVPKREVRLSYSTIEGISTFPKVSSGLAGAGAIKGAL